MAYGEGNHWTPFLQKNTGTQNPLGNYQSAYSAALAANNSQQNQGGGGGDFLSQLMSLQGTPVGTTLESMYKNSAQYNKKSFWDIISNQQKLGGYY